MAENIAELKARRVKLQQARDSGLRSFEDGSIRSVFKDDTEMRAALRDLDRRIEQAAAASGGAGARAPIRVNTTKGV